MIMSPEIVGLMGVVVLLALVLLSVQVGVALLLVGFFGYILLSGLDVALAQLGTSAFGTVSSYSLSVMPMFILMGMFLSYSGMSKDLFRAVDSWLGHFRGGMGLATIGASAIFASISGSASATTATLSRIAIPEMDRYNYDSKLSTACVAAGGTLGFLIPPSTILILYGIMTMEPVGPLLIAGLVPGILLALALMVMIHVQIRRNASLAPISPEPVSFIEKLKSFGKIWPFLLVFSLSIGGIYFGLFTPNEAGGVGAMGALLVATINRKLNWSKMVDALDESIRLTSMIFIILIGATLFAQFLAMSRIPTQLTTFVAGLDTSRYLILGGILLILFILGLFMESIAILVMTVPILHPLILELGFDGIWFGIIMGLAINIGLITPPLGVSVYIIHGVMPEISLQTIFRGVVPMIVVMVLVSVLLVIFPEIVTFLPNIMSD